MKYTVVVIMMAISITSIPFVSAATSVINNVSVSASTGGNSAASGETFIKEGVGKTKLFLKTIVNGDVVNFVDEEFENKPGEEAVFEKSSSYESADGRVVTKSNIFINESEPTEREEAGETLEKLVEKEKVTENVVAEKQTFLAAVFQKFRIYVLSIFN